MKNSLLSDLIIRKGMTLSFQNECMVELKLSNPIGKGAMTGYLLSPHVVVCLVDFACEECPSMMPGSQFSGNDIVEYIKNITKTNLVPRSAENSMPTSGFQLTTASKVVAKPISLTQVLPW